MNIIGIVVEYNPFHNGHLHHINEVKKKFPDSIIIAVLSGNYNQRGEVSIIPKWKKASLALTYGVDIVIELPYVFSSQAADIFAKGSIGILNYMKCDTLIFGSESNNIKLIKKMVSLQLTDTYDSEVRRYLNSGLNYPTSMSKVLEDLTNEKIDSPNDILGICYVKEIFKNDYKINPLTIKRTNNYHDKKLSDTVASATSIRLALKEKTDVSNYVPDETYKLLQDELFYNDMYFDILKYKILTSKDLSIYHTVDEGIEYRLKKEIVNATSYDDFISRIKTKRYTYNKISRMLTHILVDYTKEEALLTKELSYIRVLGFSELGKEYLHTVKKDIELPIITNFGKFKDVALDIEFRATCTYASVLEESLKNEMIQSEYKNKPIKRG